MVRSDYFDFVFQADIYGVSAYCELALYMDDVGFEFVQNLLNVFLVEEGEAVSEFDVVFE